jgi:hypothetical protein
MSKYWVPIIMGIIFLIIGVVCLCWPYKIQELAVKKPIFNLGGFNPFLPYMRSAAYIWVLRIIGVLSLLVFVLVVVVVTKTIILGY